MSNKIDHEITSEIVCPYCGYEEGDSWEWQHFLELGECSGECGECGKEFYITMDVDVTYSTYKTKVNE